MTTISVDPFIRRRIQPQYFARNGQLVSPDFQGQMCEVANQVSYYRTKQLACFSNTLPADQRARWRVACHTSPFADVIVFRLVVCKTLSATARITYLIENSSGTTLASDTIHAGLATSEPLTDDVPDDWTVQSIFVDASSFRDTDIRIEIYTPIIGSGIGIANYSGRIASVVIYEHARPPDTDNGFLPQGYSVGQAIRDTDRKGLVDNAISLWKRQAAPLFAYSSIADAIAPTNSANQYRNVFDGSTSVNGNTPGYLVDLSYCHTGSRTTVPCSWAVYVGTTGGSTLSVRLLDSTGATLSTLTASSGIFTGWLTGTVSLPPSLQKIDIFHTGDGTETITTYACSLWQHLA